VSGAYIVRVIAGDIVKKIPVTANEKATVSDMLRKAGVEVRSFNDLDISMASQMVTDPEQLVTTACDITVLERSSNG